VCEKKKVAYLTIKDTEIKFDEKWANGIYNSTPVFYMSEGFKTVYYESPMCKN
jgi:hypothetical protein